MFSRQEIGLEFAEYAQKCSQISYILLRGFNRRAGLREDLNP